MGAVFNRDFLSPFRHPLPNSPAFLPFLRAVSYELSAYFASQPPSLPASQLPSLPASQLPN
ncbi:hypothetical protein D1AOALGA4SA_9864 [Olavius algarvensis Delta 1 endosymbiont]|nr:hypothetical protein D1AOALGA4SA_9864 [Olavius algarvensis Delta 1 endosymbiont]